MNVNVNLVESQRTFVTRVEDFLVPEWQNVWLDEDIVIFGRLFHLREIFFCVGRIDQVHDAASVFVQFLFAHEAWVDGVEPAQVLVAVQVAENLLEVRGVDFVG